MGPPKVNPRAPISIDEYRRQIDTFEYRLNEANEGFFMFNPYTGETIHEIAEVGLTTRQTSMWFKPDKYPSLNAENIVLYPEYYASRRWGRRKFYGWASPEAAATHIAAVIRGGLTRRRMRKYYRNRYSMQLCKFAGYYFFIDNENPDANTSWHKPMLAFPTDILPSGAQDYDPDDHMRGQKYINLDIIKGPYLKVQGLNKYNKTRADNQAFSIPNAWRDSAIFRYEQIDVDTTAIGDVIAWMDGEKGSEIEINEYHLVRAAICGNNWDKVIELMRSNPDSFSIQVYGLHSFAKSEVPLDSTGIIDFCTSEVMYMCIGILETPNYEIDAMMKVFALHALYSILSCRPGRLEYMNTSEVQDHSENRAQAIQEFLGKKCLIFLTHLSNVECEDISEYEKGFKTPTIVEKPLARSIEIIQGALQCLTILCHESDTKEPLAYCMMKPVMYCLELCKEEALIVTLAMQLMYNACYRCESGQQAILVYLEPPEFFAQVTFHHGGDPDVMGMKRKLELALMENGWRGNVESNVTKEMFGEVLMRDVTTPVARKKKSDKDRGSGGSVGSRASRK